MFHWFKVVSVSAALLTMLHCSICSAEECEALKFASANDAVNEVEQGRIQTATCAKAAFQLIRHLPEEEAIPILIKYLGYKRPQTDAEKHGFYIHGPSPDVLYPAVESLYDIGSPAESRLIDAIARNDSKDSIEYKNALYTLVLIHHSDMVPLLKALHGRSVELAGTPEGARLESVAQDVKKQHCQGKLQAACDNALNEVSPEN